MKYLLLGLVSLISTLSFGQSKKFTFKLGTAYELPKKSEDLSFFGNDKDGIVNLSLKKEELTITRFNSTTLAQTSDKVIELTDATSNLNSETVVDFGTNIFWLHSDWDKSAQTEVLTCDKIDVATGKISEPGKKLIESGKIAGVQIDKGFYNKKTEDKYAYKYDVDHKKLLVCYRLLPEVKNDKKSYDKVGVFVFDENMNKLWGSEFTMPYTEQIMDNADFSIDGQGNAYMLAKVYDSEKRKEVDKETGLAAYHFEVFKFTKDNKKIITANISVDNFFIKETNLIESTTHDMIIACTYSKKAKKSGTDGIFLAQLDQAGKVVKFKNGYYEFPLEELTKFETAKKKRKMEKAGDYEAPNIRVRNIEIGNDGSVFIACEEFYVTVINRSNNSYGRLTTSSYTYVFNYEDILAAKIAPSGQFEWLRKIPKKQRSGEQSRYLTAHPYQGTLGFKLIHDASGYYFLYLDNKKNVELEEDEAPKYHQDGFGGQVMVTKLDPNGVMTKELLFDTRDEDVMIYPAKFSRINKNQFIGRAKLDKNHFEPLLITVN